MLCDKSKSSHCALHCPSTLGCDRLEVFTLSAIRISLVDIIFGFGTLKTPMVEHR